MWRDKCANCPDLGRGSMCEELGRRAPKQSKGYWLTKDGEDQWEVYRCTSDEACPETENPQEEGARCSGNRDDDSIACARCQEGSHSAFGRCLPCTDDSGFTWIIVCLLGLIGIAAKYYMSGTNISSRINHQHESTVAFGIIFAMRGKSA